MDRESDRVVKNTGKGEVQRDFPTKVDLEPCDRPQAAEVSRLQTEDEACDDGVH
jgi:hypothetical protein